MSNAHAPAVPASSPAAVLRDFQSASGRNLVPHLASKSVMVIVPFSDFKLGDGLMLLWMKNPGSFGSGRTAPSLPNIETTDGMVGLSSANFWTHNNPTWMHLFT